MKKQVPPNGDTLLEPTIDDLLKILPEKIPHLVLSAENAIKMLKIACILANSHAQQAFNTLSSIARLFPEPDSKSMAYQAIGEPAMRALQIQNERASAVAKKCRAQIAQWCKDYPEAAESQHGDKADISTFTERYTYPLWTMLQILPHDITNQNSLDDEQRKMCMAVSGLSGHTQNTLWDGLEAIGDLLTVAGQHVTPEKLPQLGGLIRHLSSEARYMAQNAQEYFDAACNIPRAEAT
jgi:hypothetical protein